MPKSIKVGIAGLGAIASSVHIPALSSIGKAELVAACDTDSTTRRRQQHRWRIPSVYEHYEEMYRKSDLDAVFVCLPTTHHYHAVRNALKEDIHVFCEKPMGVSSDEAYELTTIAKDRGLVLMVGYMKRFIRNYQKAAQIVRKGKLGRTLQVHGTLLNLGPYAGWSPKSDWFLDERAGGALYDNGSHLLDLITYMTADRICEVYGTCVSTYCMEGIKDNVAGIFLTEGEILGTLNVGWRAAPMSEFVAFFGTAGLLIVDQYEVNLRYGSYGPLDAALDKMAIIKHLRSAGKIVRTQLSRAGPLRTPEAEYLRQDCAFVEAVLCKEDSPVSGEDALRTLEALEAFKESFRERKPVKVRKHQL